MSAVHRRQSNPPCRTPGPGEIGRALRRSAASGHPAGPQALSTRLLVGGRLLILSAGLLAAAGMIGHIIGLILLTTTVGPTGYLLLAHPDTEAAQVRCAALGHLAATVCGLACLAAFGLWSRPSIAQQGADSLPQIGAQALAVGLTLLALVALNADHPPAAATALMITSGIARPGPPLYGMLIGLAIVITTAAALAKVPWLRERTRRTFH
ncbi:HPP family protein [Streptomyces sp. RB6PN25]|uniref:HPP family protein n=1 Tax=Streptomyces humicola TaxID=2953240 RepID=A0ABT1PTE4_9ACTN|nr:HPP family protein [Streptomyces humicola]MCQ4080940.1 HPP family protein [Streptomyces humicola]